MAQVKKGDRVRFNYTLTLKDGKVYESNMGQPPLEITVGKGKAIKGLENALVGMSPGQTKVVVVKPADGYGPKDPAFVWTVPVAELPAGSAVGSEVGFARADATRVEGRVAKIDGELATVDGNHPLAGRNLTFEIKLVAVG
jgi:peptidylprolyl isomerase